MFRWYVVNTYSGHENKVKHNLEHRVVSLGQQRAVRNVVVPTEAVSEMKDNQKVTVEKRTMPGYVLVNMELNEDSWGVVKGTPGVTGFVGASQEPVPLTQVEVDRLLHKEVATATRTRAQFAIGESVKVVSGPLSDFSGEISEINEDAARLKVLVSIFGRRDPRGGRLRPSQKALRDGQEGSDNDQAAGERRAGEPRPAGRSRAGPARDQHHGVLQGVQRPDAERNGHRDPGRDHGL